MSRRGGNNNAGRGGRGNQPSPATGGRGGAGRAWPNAQAAQAAQGQAQLVRPEASSAQLRPTAQPFTPSGRGRGGAPATAGAQPQPRVAWGGSTTRPAWGGSSTPAGAPNLSQQSLPQTAPAPNPTPAGLGGSVWGRPAIAGAQTQPPVSVPLAGAQAQPPVGASSTPAPVQGGAVGGSPAIAGAQAQPPVAVPMVGISSTSVGESTKSQEFALETTLFPVREGPPTSSKAITVPSRPQYGTVGRKCVVRANHFLVELADNDLYHYDVSISPEAMKITSRAIISELVRSSRTTELGGKMPAYDGSKSLYTAGRLPFEKKEFPITLPATTERAEKQYTVTIKNVGRPSVYNLQEFLSGRQKEVPQDAIQALDVVLRQTPSTEYKIVGRSFFSPVDKCDIQEGVECWRGFYQSLRPTQMGLSLNIDSAATSFYKELPVIDFLVQHLNIRDPNRMLSNNDRIKTRKTLRGLRVETIHTGIRYKITDLSTPTLGNITFSMGEHGPRISIVDYFRDTYNIRLRYTNLPCLQYGNPDRARYLPMELCKIVSGQRYAKKLNERQVTAMLKATCKRPEERETDIKKMALKNKYKSDVYVSEFGLGVLENMVSVEARILPTPMLKYHDTGREKTCSPRDGSWNMMGKKLVQGGRVDHWTCISFSRNMYQQGVTHFCNEMVKTCTASGMTFNPRPCIQPVVADNNANVENALINLHRDVLRSVPNGKLQLLLIILPEMNGLYGRIKKICETELGIVSQCLKAKNILKNSRQFLENVALKINVKVGGRNTVLADALKVPKGIPFLTDIPTIIFGADVTHPPPGEDSSPSIAAVVGSMDWPEVTKYKGLISSQAHRVEMITDLYSPTGNDQKKGTPGGMIRELLISFYKANNQRKPSRIIFYRDGVSEGQFREVLFSEVDQIRRACNSIQENYLPPITFVVVQKRHHTRLFPEVHSRGGQFTDRSGNVLPGTVVDRKICHPTEFDFYLCSHAGIQGTSRPTHYHVLHDENNFTADALQTLTYNLCYTYARCTKSVSIVPPAYYAHLAAYRARYYIGADQSDGESEPVQFHQMPRVQDNVKEVMFFC